MNMESQGITERPGRGDMRVGRHRCCGEGFDCQEGGDLQICVFGPFADGEAVDALFVNSLATQITWAAATPVITVQGLLVRIAAFKVRPTAANFDSGKSFCAGQQLNLPTGSVILPISFLAGREGLRWIGVELGTGNIAASQQILGSVWCRALGDPSPLAAD